MICRFKIGRQYGTDTQCVSICIKVEIIVEDPILQNLVKFKRLKFFCLHLLFLSSNISLGVSIISLALELEDNAHGI